MHKARTDDCDLDVYFKSVLLADWISLVKYFANISITELTCVVTILCLREMGLPKTIIQECLNFGSFVKFRSPFPLEEL